MRPNLSTALQRIRSMPISVIALALIWDLIKDENLSLANRKATLLDFFCFSHHHSYQGEKFQKVSYQAT